MTYTLWNVVGREEQVCQVWPAGAGFLSAADAAKEARRLPQGRYEVCDDTGHCVATVDTRPVEEAPVAAFAAPSPRKVPRWLELEIREGAADN